MYLRLIQKYKKYIKKILIKFFDKQLRYKLEKHKFHKKSNISRISREEKRN